jgi:hypothetical protein
MSRTREVRRLHRSFAAVEARYVRDLGRRERGNAPAARSEAGPDVPEATQRLDVVHRRVAAGRSRERASDRQPRARIRHRARLADQGVRP